MSIEDLKTVSGINGIDPLELNDVVFSYNNLMAWSPNYVFFLVDSGLEKHKISFIPRNPGTETRIVSL